MGENKRFRKQIRGWEKQIARHEAKIAREMRKDFPNSAYIEGWEKEIRGWQQQIEQRLERLKKKRN